MSFYFFIYLIQYLISILFIDHHLRLCIHVKHFKKATQLIQMCIKICSLEKVYIVFLIYVTYDSTKKKNYMIMVETKTPAVVSLLKAK